MRKKESSSIYERRFLELWGRRLSPLFLFSDVFFPIRERLPGAWLIVAEALPLLHPVRLARSAFQGEWGWIALWDVGYILVVSAVLLEFARRGVRKRLMS